MTLAQAQALAATIETHLAEIEAAKGPQPRLRHLLHAAQAEAENVIGAAPGSITPAGGTSKPGASS